MTMGFGAKQDIDNSQLLPMIFATLGMAVSIFLGMVVGHENFLLVGMAALWGFGYGMLTAREGGYGWVGQQCVVMLVVGSAFPISPRQAAERALLVLAGGAIQVLSSSVILRLFGELQAHLRALTGYIQSGTGGAADGHAECGGIVEGGEAEGIRRCPMPFAWRSRWR